MRMRRRVLCLDWDKRSVRLLVARVGGGRMTLEDAHAHRIPADVNTDDPAALGAVIAAGMAAHRIRRRDVIVDVPRDKSVIARLPLPPTPIAELPDVVRFQAVKELPFPVEDAALDFVTLTADAERKTATEVLLAAVRKDVLGRIRETCAAAGLRPTRIGLRPYANLVSVMHLPGMADRRVLFVDVGPALTEINVVHGGRLAFTRAANVSVPVLGDDDRWQSSRLVVVGGGGEEDAISGAIHDLVVEVVRSLQAYRATESNVVIDNVIVAGHTGVETELAQALEKRLALATDLFDPALPLGITGDRGAELRGFSAVLGLAWGLSTRGLLELDFLNPKRVVRRSETIIRRARLAGLAATAAAVGAVAMTWSAYRAKAAELSGIRKGMEELRKVVRDSRDLSNRSAEWDEWQHDAVWLDHLMILSRALPGPGREVIIRSLAFDSSSSSIRVDLIATRREIVTQFVDVLADLRVGGVPDEPQDPGSPKLYRVEQGSWVEGNTTEPGFAGSTQVILRVVDVEEFQSPAAVNARRAERERFAREF